MQVFKEPSIIFLFAENTVAAIYLCIYAGKIDSLMNKTWFLCSSGSLKPPHSCRAFFEDFIFISGFNLHFRFNEKFFSLCEKRRGVLSRVPE